MVSESERLARIVEDLLDLSIVEAQETRGREPLPVTALIVDDAVDQVRWAAEAAGIAIEAVERACGSLGVELRPPSGW